MLFLFRKKNKASLIRWTRILLIKVMMPRCSCIFQNGRQAKTNRCAAHCTPSEPVGRSLQVFYKGDAASLICLFSQVTRHQFEKKEKILYRKVSPSFMQKLSFQRWNISLMMWPHRLIYMLPLIILNLTYSVFHFPHYSGSWPQQQCGDFFQRKQVICTVETSP